jgi:parvulin-like peptidyl-prolyl isomerase
MMRKTLLLGMLLAVAAGLNTGCGSDEEVLAVVGDHKITTTEFFDFYGRGNRQYASAQEEFDRKREVLDSLITVRLLVDAAYEKGIDQREELQRVLLANRDRFLLDAFYETSIADRAEPSAAAVKRFWEKLEYRIRASHILLGEPDTAQLVLEKLRSGENFEKLAYDYSRDPSAKRNKGDLGYFVWGAMVPEFQEAAFQMDVGEVSPPVKSPYGYHIIKLVDRLPNEARGSLDQMRDEITQQLKGLKEKELMERLLEDIKERYTVRVDTSVLQYLVHKRQQLYPEMILKGLPAGDFDSQQLDRNEKELIVANWEGGQMTVGEYLSRISNLSNNQKPSFTAYDSLANMIFELKKLDLLILEAHRQGIDNDPRYLRRVRLFKELNMAELMRSDSIAAPMEPTEEMAREYYDANPEEFTIPRRVRVYEIMLSDSSEIDRLAEKKWSLAEFREYARKHTKRPGKRTAQGDLGYIERDWFPEMFDLAWKTPINRVAGPVTGQRENMYSLIYVEAKQESTVKDYLDQKRLILQKLRTEQKNHAIQSWINERKKQVRIVVNDDAVWSTIDTKQYATLGDGTQG